MTDLNLQNSHNHNDLSKVWIALDGTIFHVIEDDSETAVDVAAAAVRHVCGKFWLCWNGTDGYSIVTEEEVESWALATKYDSHIRNKWDKQWRVWRDGRYLRDEADDA